MNEDIILTFIFFNIFYTWFLFPFVIESPKLALFLLQILSSFTLSVMIIIIIQSDIIYSNVYHVFYK